MEENSAALPNSFPPNPQRIESLVNWLRANRQYTPDQLWASAQQGGFTKEEFNQAWQIFQQPQPQTYRYAGAGIRFLALMIDNLVISVLAALGGGILNLFCLQLQCSTAVSGIIMILQFILLVALVAWPVYWEWKKGASLGKQILKLRVLDERGGPLSIKAVIIRDLLRSIDFSLLGLILIWTNPQKQRLGDRLAHTIVIRE